MALQFADAHVAGGQHLPLRLGSKQYMVRMKYLGSRGVLIADDAAICVHPVHRAGQYEFPAQLLIHSAKFTSDLPDFAMYVTVVAVEYRAGLYLKFIV